MNNPHIKYDLEKNELQIFHNQFEEQPYYYDPYDDSIPYTIAKTKNENKFLGIVIQKFINTESIHYKGLQAEEAFKHLLNNFNIPCLYVGQGINYKERNPKILHFKEEITIKRPDYLVSFPELGTVLIDVKCRRKKPFFEESSVFYIHYNDIEQLYETRNYMNLPVWVAFKDSQDSENQDFYMCSIKILKNLKDKFFEQSGKNINTCHTQHLRVPNSILNNFSKNTLINPLNNFDTDTFMEQLLLLETGKNVNSEYYLEEEKKNFFQKK